MAAEPKPTTPVEDTSMNWVMILWLAAFIGAVLFGIAAYIYNWFAGR